jgi:hypothetical protein
MQNYTITNASVAKYAYLHLTLNAIIVVGAEPIMPPRTPPSFSTAYVVQQAAAPAKAHENKAAEIHIFYLTQCIKHTFRFYEVFIDTQRDVKGGLANSVFCRQRTCRLPTFFSKKNSELTSHLWQ